MTDPDLTFAIPTYRLRDVGAAVEAYDANFARNGHAVPIVVFDDSSPAAHAKYYPLLEKTRTHNELFYVGPAEKEQFFTYLGKRLREKTLHALVRGLFRPSYGGNRNFTLMYTLGDLMVSSDDDMRPEALVEDSPESLGPDEVARGRLYRRDAAGFTARSFDLVRSFRDVLGKTAAEVPHNYGKGELLVDSATDLETNSSVGLHRENAVVLKPGKVSRKAVVKMAQTYRSGTNDIDALDFAELFLDDHSSADIDALNELYVLVNFRPAITNENWRMDCGVAGYDNTLGLPPFFPTRLRCEDYIYRLWVRQEGVLAAHVDAAQTHTKSNYMRNPLAAEVFNEEVSNLLKRKVKDSIGKLDDLTISFDYEGEVSADDTERILDKIRAYHGRFVDAAAKATDPARRDALSGFAINLEKAFYGFEPDFFQQNVSRIMDDVVGQIKASLELWPTLVEIAYFQKKRKRLPMTRVKNQRRG